MTLLQMLKLRRIHLAIMIFIGLMVSYMLRLNINIAIIKMMNSTDTANSTNVVNWTQQDKGNIIGAFFWGYMILQVPSGRLSEIYGTKKILGFGLFFTAVLTALTPLACTVSPWLVFALRVVQGFLECPSFPALNPATSKWVPADERGKFMSFSYLGGSFGTVLTFPLCGYILQHLEWQWVFYVTSILAVVWFIFWLLLVYDDPEDDPYISQEEKDYILKTRTFNAQQQEADLKVPLFHLFFDILLTPAMWVTMIGDFVNGWGLYTLLTEGPTYMAEVLDFPIEENGWVSMLPQLSRTIMGTLIGFVTDFAITRKVMTRLTSQKIATSFSFLCPAIGMVALSFLSSSGTAFGTSNGFGNLSGIVVPFVVTVLTQDNPKSAVSWRWVFFIAAILYGLEVIYFWICASGKIQAFNYKSYENADFKTELKKKLSQWRRVPPKPFKVVD